jgi:monofunctional biosynthetic peptidoglycan transglycosylase
LRAFRILLLIVLVALAVPYALAPFYRTGHPVSALMALRQLEGDPVIRHWVDLSAMSPYLSAAVVGAEDAHFCKHHGVDFGALREAITTAEEGGELRGASTITQQVAKNLFLAWLPDLIRKVFEFPLALWIDFVLPKQRILEIYLNIAALGPSGQFGAEAGAEYAFGHSAATLTAREAALLASILPNPVKRSAKTPSPGLRRLAGVHMVRAADVRRCWTENR